MDNKTTQWKKILMIVGLLLLPALAFGAGDSLDQANTSIVKGMRTAGLIFVFVVNMFWVIIPMGLAWLSYSIFKKKSEQSQEDLGMKAGLGVFASAIVGGFAAFYLVGVIGQYAGSKDSLAEGNEYMISSFLGVMVDSLKTEIETSATAVKAD